MRRFARTQALDFLERQQGSELTDAQAEDLALEAQAWPGDRLVSARAKRSRRCLAQRFLRESAFELVVSPAIVDEVLRGLRYPKVTKYIRPEIEPEDASLVHTGDPSFG